MEHQHSNVAVLEQLKNGTAHFELVSSPVVSVSASSNSQAALVSEYSHSFFARIGPPLGRGSSARRKVERYSIHRVTGDARCLFRALVKGMAANKGSSLSPIEETESADELRMAVKEAICDNEEQRSEYEAAVAAITIDNSLKRYCQRISRPDFWGGDSELLVLSKLCKQPIIVYVPEHEHTNGGRGSGFNPKKEHGSEFTKVSRNRTPRSPVRLLYSIFMGWLKELEHTNDGRRFGFISIQEYGREFTKGSRNGDPRKPVRLLYSGRKHYDLLV